MKGLKLIGHTQGKLKHTVAKKKKRANSFREVQDNIRPYRFSSLVRSLKRAKLEEEKGNFAFTLSELHNKIKQKLLVYYHIECGTMQISEIFHLRSCILQCQNFEEY